MSAACSRYWLPGDVGYSWKSKVSRKLAAILAADIAGYSALMGADEGATRS